MLRNKFFILIFLGALCLAPALALNVFAENSPGERSLKSIHDEFMGYAKEYYDEQKHYAYKARSSSGSERSGLQKAADLSRQMGDVKQRMARGYLHDNMSEVKSAEKEYYRLRDERDHVLKKLKGYH